MLRGSMLLLMQAVCGLDLPLKKAVFMHQLKVSLDRGALKMLEC